MKKQKKIKEKKVKKMIEKAYHEGFEAGQHEAASLRKKKEVIKPSERVRELAEEIYKKLYGTKPQN